MRRAALIFVVALPLTWAQQTPSPTTTTVEGTTPRSTTERPNVSAAGMDQTLTGILMDAGCKAIVSTRPTADLTQMPSQSRTPPAMRQDGQTGAAAQSTQGETARTQTEQEARSLKVYTAPGSTPAQAGTPAAGARTDADDKLPRLTESRSPGTTATTGTAASTAPTEASIARPASPQAEGTGERARAASSSADESMVREKYGECLVTPSTTSFAMHAGGQLYVMDRASNAMIQEQMRNEAFRASMSNARGDSRWSTVTVQGTPTSDNTLTIRSVRK